MASYKAKNGVCGLFRLYGARVEKDEGSSTYREGAFIPFCIQCHYRFSDSDSLPFNLWVNVCK